MRILFVELDGIWKAVGVIKRISCMYFGVLVFFHGFDNSRQLEHNLFHSLKELIIVLVVWSIRQPFDGWVLIVWVGLDGRDVYIFGEKGVFDFSELEL